MDIIVLSSGSGDVLEGILLTFDATSLRIVCPGCSDVLELRKVQNQWRTPDGQTFELEALLNGVSAGLPIPERARTAPTAA